MVALSFPCYPPMPVFPLNFPSYCTTEIIQGQVVGPLAVATCHLPGDSVVNKGPSLQGWSGS